MMRRAKQMAWLLAVVILSAVGINSNFAVATPSTIVASDVIGQVNFTSNTSGLSATQLNNPTSTALDLVHHRLFVSEYENSRVLVFNLGSDNILHDKTADYVIGQTSFTANSTGLDASSFYRVYDVAYDSVHDRLFVVDVSNYRIMVFNLANGISNGMPASHVIGQADFESNSSLLSATHFDTSYTNIAIDEAGQRLFVAAYEQNRVLVFNIAPDSIANGMAASNVFGQVDLTSGQPNRGDLNPTANTLYGPIGLSYDATRHRLFVGDYSNVRYLVYDLSSGISNGMAADKVLCQPDFISSDTSTTQSTCSQPEDITYDPTNNRVFAYDFGNGRILIFNLEGGITNGMSASAVIGQPDFETANPPAATDSTFNLYDSASNSYDPVNNILYATDGNNNRILTFTLGQRVDQDGVGSAAEDAAPNGGDANGDGTDDSAQANVTSLPSLASGKYMALESTCASNSNVQVNGESTSSADKQYDYPAGGWWVLHWFAAYPAVLPQ